MAPNYRTTCIVTLTLNKVITISLLLCLSPCIITGDQLRPDMLLSIGKTMLYVIELTVGFETNLNSNAERKREKYYQLTRDLSSDFHYVKFINISLSALGVFGKSCEPFIDMCKELEFDKQHRFHSAKDIKNHYSINLLYILYA